MVCIFSLETFAYDVRVNAYIFFNALISHNISSNRFVELDLLIYTLLRPVSQNLGTDKIPLPRCIKCGSETV